MGNAQVGGRLWPGLMVSAMIVTAVVAFLMFRPDRRDAPSSAAPATGAPEAVIADLPGLPNDMPWVRTFQDVEQISYLTQEEVGVYREGGADAASMATTNHLGVRVVVLVVTVRSATAAVTARDALAQLQRGFGMAARPGPAGIDVSSAVTAEGVLTRATYVSGQRVVRLQTQGANGAAAQDEFDAVLAAQVDRLPVDG